VPLVLHEASDLVGRLVADEGADKVEGGVEARGDSTTGDDAQTAQLERGSSGVALSARVALLERETALSGVARAAAVFVTAADIWVVVLLAQVEAEVVDDVALLHDVGALRHVALGRRLAQVLQSDDEVGVGGGAEAGEDTGLGQEEGARADGHEGTLAAGVLDLHVGVGLDEAQWLHLVLQDLIGAASGDDEDVELGKALVGILEGDV